MPREANGWLPSPRGAGGPGDPGGPGARPLRPPGRSPAPSSISLTQKPRIRDQGELGCCVSIAIVGAIELLLGEARAGQASPLLSPLFHYYVARSDPTTLSPLSLIDGLQAAVSAGICRLRLHNPPWTPAGAKTPPTEAAIADAEALAGRRFNPAIGAMRGRFEFQRLPEFNRGAAWQATLAAGWPVVCGLWMTPGYRAIKGRQNVHSALVEPRESVGHAVLVIGYRQDRGFWIADSKGRNFGSRGTWWLPAELVETPLLQESWLLRPSESL